MHTATICGRSSSGPPTKDSQSSRQPDPRSSSTSEPWRVGALRRPPSTGGCLPSAASTVRPHRWPDRIQPRPVRPPAQGPPQRRPRPGPLGAGDVSVRCRADRPRPRVLAVLLGLNGLRVSEACSADIENLGFDRGHRTLRIVGKGNKPAVIPLVPRTARTIDLAIGERTAGPILLRHDGSRLDRRTAHRWVRSTAKRAGLGHVHPPCSARRSSCAPSRQESRSAKCRIAARHADPRTTTVYDHRRQSFDRHAAYVVVAFVAGG